MRAQILKFAMSDQQGVEHGKSEAETKAHLKDSARESRFTFRNAAEYQLRRELKEEAMEKCDPEIKRFAECSTEKGLMVIFSCKTLFREVNECMHTHNGEEAWQAFKAKNQDEIDRRANIR